MISDASQQAPTGRRMAPSRNCRSRVDGRPGYEGASGLKYCPPGSGVVQPRATSAPASPGASAATAGRARAHHQHVQAIPGRWVRASLAAAGATGAEPTSMPSCDLGQAGALARPAVDASPGSRSRRPCRKRPARRARPGSARATISAAASAAAIVSPGAPRSRGRRSGGDRRAGGPHVGCSGAWQKVYNAKQRGQVQREP